MGIGEVPGPGADRIGQEQLTARRRPQACVGDAQAALVGDREVAHLVHRVAEELDPDGVLFRGREDIEDAASHRELAAPFHQFDPGVGEVGQAGHDVFQGRFVARAQGDRLQVAEPGDLRLQHRAHGGDDHAERAAGRVRQPVQHGQPPSHRVGAGAEPFVRERLPARIQGYGVGVEQAGEGLGEVFGLPAGGGDSDDEPGRSGGRPGAGRPCRCPSPHPSAGARQARDQ